MPTLTVDDIKVEVPDGTTILQAARQAGSKVPSLCYLEDVQTIGACRVCLVEVEGAKALVASCAAPAAEGMIVKTNSALARKGRQTVVELLLSEHDGNCQTCARSADCELRTLARDLGIDEIRYEGDKTTRTIDDSTPALVRDSGKCIMCRRCVTVCNETQGVGALFPQGRGFTTVIGPAFATDLADVTCVQCGQCAAVCPVGAITERDQIDQVWAALDDPDKHVVVQTAPAIRAALGEGFDYEPGTLVTGKMVAALRRLGFDGVFDTNFAADLTIMEEGTELLMRLKAALVDKQRRRPADVHELLAGLDQLHGALQPRLPAQPLDLQEPAADVRRGGQDLLRREARQAARGHLRGQRHALHGQEVRVPAPGDGRLGHAGRRRRAHHARAGAHDQAGRHRLRQPARRDHGLTARPLDRRRRHLRQHRRRHGGRAAHGLRDRHRQAVPLREPARHSRSPGSRASRRPRCRSWAPCRSGRSSRASR